MATMGQSQCWCETDTDEHDERCDMAPMKLTKEAFVDAAEGGAKAAVEDYLFMVEEGFSHDEALSVAIDQARESAACFAGVGSCGGGGCKH